MLGLYSFLLTLGMTLVSPLFLLRRQKYASGFRERLGHYPEFNHDDRKVIWLHCVSVGETVDAPRILAQPGTGPRGALRFLSALARLTRKSPGQIDLQALATGMAK